MNTTQAEARLITALENAELALTAIAFGATGPDAIAAKSLQQVTRALGREPMTSHPDNHQALPVNTEQVSSFTTEAGDTYHRGDRSVWSAECWAAMVTNATEQEIDPIVFWVDVDGHRWTVPR